MKKILCATDHSEVAQKAEAVAADWAKRFQAELIYAYVSRLTDEDLGPTGSSSSSVTILKNAALQENEILRHALETSKEADVEADFIFLRSHKTADALINYALKESVDHIIVGSVSREGIGGVARALLGSVSQKIISNSHCDVTVVH